MIQKLKFVRNQAAKPVDIKAALRPTGEKRRDVRCAHDRILALLVTGFFHGRGRRPLRSSVAGAACSGPPEGRSPGATVVQPGWKRWKLWTQWTIVS